MIIIVVVVISRSCSSCRCCSPSSSSSSSSSSCSCSCSCRCSSGSSSSSSSSSRSSSSVADHADAHNVITCVKHKIVANIVAFSCCSPSPVNQHMLWAGDSRVLAFGRKRARRPDIHEEHANRTCLNRLDVGVCCCCRDVYCCCSCCGVIFVLRAHSLLLAVADDVATP